MKWVLISIIGILTLISAVLYLLGADDSRNVLYLQITPSAENDKRLELFHQWLAENGHPGVDLRLNASGADISKTIMEGISGVASDLLVLNGGADLQYLQSIGMLTDLTDVAQAAGISPEHFMPAVRNEMLVDGRQYAVAQSLFLLMIYINRQTFEDLDLEVPPARMTWDDFERRGKEFVKRANPPGQELRRFFISGLNRETMRRSAGLDTFNETLTRCILDDPRNAQALELLHKWTFVDRLLPSASDMASLTSAGSASGFGPRIYQFKIGNIAMIDGGSYLKTVLREQGDIPLALAAPPYLEFPNAILGGFDVAIYAGSKHKDKAILFLQFLLSDSYQQTLVEFGDSMPALASTAGSEAYLHPPDHPNEWMSNDEFFRSVQEIGIPYTVCPYVNTRITGRIVKSEYDRFMTGLQTAEEAARHMADRVNDEIARSIATKPAQRPKYEQARKLQKQIDARRARGEKVPLEWISNPFYRAYYQSKGWAE